MIKCPKLPIDSDEFSWNCTEAFHSAPEWDLTWLQGPNEEFKGGRARVGWTTDALWVWAVEADDCVTTEATADGQRLYTLGDVIEVFFRDLRESGYEEMHVDPPGHRFHLRFPDETAVVRVRAKEEKLQKYVLEEPGFDTLTRKTEEGWEALVRVPWRLGPPLAGGTGLISVSRYDYGTDKDVPVLSSTSRHEVVNFHRQHEWSPIVFAGAPVVVDPASFICIATGIPGCEGPLATREGRIFVVEPSAGTVWEIGQDGARSIAAQTGGVPAGLQLHPDGSIWIADMKRGILRFFEGAPVEVVVGSFDGQPIRGCNDLAFDSVGNLYFTAPAGSKADSPCGEVYCRLLSGEVRLLDAGFAFCNGIAVSADDRTLIVAETFTRKLHAYAIERPGVVGERIHFATVTGEHRVGPDGIDFDEEGRLITTNLGEGCLDVLAADGALVGTVRLPFGKPSNVHFAGPDSTTLLITEHSSGALWRCEWPGAGQRQYGWTKGESLPSS